MAFFGVDFFLAAFLGADFSWRAFFVLSSSPEDARLHRSTQRGSAA